jgi:hypothetical protein
MENIRIDVESVKLISSVVKGNSDPAEAVVEI